MVRIVRLGARAEGPQQVEVRFGCQELNAPVGEAEVRAAGVATAEGADPHVDVSGLKLRRRCRPADSARRGRRRKKAIDN